MAETLQGIGPRSLGRSDGDEAPATPDELSSRLADLCRRMGVTIEIHPGLDDDAPPLTGDRRERYTLGPEIGHGGGGRVILATDRDLRRSVALKVLAERHAGDPQRVQAFLEEAVITAGLEHPNIAPVYDLGWSPILGFYYTMKRLSGRTLVDILDGLRQSDSEEQRSFGLFRALGAFVELCRAVAHAHQRGVIHSDLKPDNVIVGEYGEIVVVDWGMAQLLGPTGASQVRAKIRGGTPEYMAPEQFTETGATLGVSVDVWALGVILYELLTLSVPFRGETADEIGMRVMIEPVTPPAKRAPARPIPPGIEQICMRALERDLSRRYPTVAELLGDVEAWLAGTRERMRRAEQVLHALETAEAVLSPNETLEEELDRALASPDAHASEGEDLEFGRGELLTAYEQAGAALLRGLEIDREAGPLQRLAGDLYWRLFTRIYPSRVRPSPELRERAIALLSRLSQRACASIVQVGQELGRSEELTPSSSTGEPEGSVWLTVAQMVARRDPDLAHDSAMSTVLSRVTSLKEIPLFQSMPAASLLPIAEACRDVSYAAGATIFGQGDPGDTLHVLLEGYVDILRDGAVINTLEPGECFGEIAVLGEATRTASAVAVDAVRTLALDAPRFRQIVRESGEIGLAVIQSLNDRLRVATRREAALRSLASTILAHKTDFE
ncbi:MAG: protein kinase [Myxococcales bacterium]|nr:protein kinase [Myxococcales bacterium]